MKILFLATVAILGATACTAQLRLDEVEAILEKDTGVSIIEVPVPVVEIKRKRLPQLPAIKNDYGIHLVDSFTTNDASNNILVINEPNGRENFLLRFTKNKSNFDFGYLYRFEFHNSRRDKSVMTASPYEEQGIVIRDKSSNYTFFVQVSRRENTVQTDALPATPNSLFKNSISSIYLFNADFSLTCIFTIHKNSIRINALTPLPKKMVIPGDDQLLRSLDHQKLVDLWKRSQETGAPVPGYKIDKAWGLDPG